jgi:hypothetical protein
MAEPTTISITLDLDKHLAGAPIIDNDGEYVGSGATTLEEVVLGMAAKQLFDSVIRNRDMHAPLRDRVHKVRDEVIRSKIEPVIEEALSAPIRRTNSFGESVGDETTLRTLIADQANAALKVSNTTNPNRFRDADTTLSKFIRDEIDRALKAELKTALDEAKAQVLARVQEAGGEVIAETLKRAAGKF